MKSKKYIIPTLALGTLLTIGILSVNLVRADDNYGGRSSIIQKLAERFNVEENEVQAVFDATHDEMREHMVGEMDERLSQAVSAGSITEEQKQALVAKREEMLEQKGELMNLNAEERHEVMEAHRGQFKVWAEENGIDLENLDEFHHGKEGFKRGFHHMY